MPDTEFRLQAAGDVALVTLDDGEDHTKPTVLGRSAFESLARLLPELEDGGWAALVLTGKPFVFCAGADLEEFPQRTTRELASEGSRVGHELFARLRALPFPTVAAINGACVGGGVELALHCDARTISTAVRHFAAPECSLGIVPAWGGTQLVPRLVGPETAVTFVVDNAMRQNRMLTGPEAFELGFADRLLEPVEFLDESLAFARELVRSGPATGQTPDLSGAAEVIRKARAWLDDTLHGAAPAPYRALDLIEGACSGWTLEEGYRAEEEALGELLPGPEAQASVYAYRLVERRRPDLAGESRRVEQVGLVGAGLMATQLASLFLKRLRVPLAIRDVDEAALERAVASLRGEVDPFLGSIVTGTTGYDGFEDCDLVLEAVFEDLDVKRRVFAELREAAPRAILATNTSALSVAEMGADVGMHFFNPVAVLPLVELVRHDGTTEEALATAAAVAAALRKRPVVVADAPGFVVNRVLTRMTRVLLDALEHGNTTEETDEAILRLGLPMAPSVLLQLVGPKVANHVLETMHAAYPDRFPLSPGLAALAEGAAEVPVLEDRRRTVEEITEDALEAIGDEIRHLLDEGVVADAADVDRCLILGAGFPFWLGGITPYLDRRIGYSPV